MYTGVFLMLNLSLECVFQSTLFVWRPLFPNMTLWEGQAGKLKGWDNDILLYSCCTVIGNLKYHYHLPFLIDQQLK